MYKEYTIWKKTEIHTRGCPEDESKSTNTHIHFFLIEAKYTENFRKHMANDYGYQEDYNYQVKYKKITELYLDEVKELSKLLAEELLKIEKEEEENERLYWQNM